jgi:putative DNA primase/helicase
MAVSPSIRFADVAAAALERARALLPEWLPGAPKGREWIGVSKSNGGLGDSWSVNLQSGHWAHFAGDERGKDLISLYAELNHLTQLAALEQVAAQVGVTDIPVNVLPAHAPREYPAELIPDNAPPLIPHYKWGKETAVWRYGQSFLVARYDLPVGTKAFIPFTWRNGKWAMKGYPEPRPIYNLTDFAKHPDAPVIVVEGEKCAEVARKVFRGHVVTTWSHGSNCVDKNDWGPLTGREVIIWPDADDAGRKAASLLSVILESTARRVRVVNPNGQPEGWDIADAVAESWDTARIAQWVSEHSRDPEEAKPVAIIDKTEREPIIESGDRDDSALVSWQSLGLDTNQGGLPYPTLANASKILQIHPKIRGKIWYDTFQRKVWHTLRGGVKHEWEDSDAADLTVFIQQSMHLPKFNTSLIQDAANHAARRASLNSLTDYLNGLKWDGVERLDTWIGDILGCERTTYSMAVAKNWLISMVARAYVPGCQVDTMPVLEGYQGRGKSKFLEVLGGDWFGTVTTDIGETDFIQEIQGIWLVEIPDMTGFGRREHTQILSTITVRIDRYRPSYGRHVENRPRTCVLAATSETDDYLSDTRGRRRFWPLRCNEISLDTLYDQRDKLFAEAVARYRAGETWHEMPDETDLEQLDRMQDDLWTEQVLNYADQIQPQLSAGSMKIIAVPAYVLYDVLKIELGDQTHKERVRVAGILQKAGWRSDKHKGNRCWVKPRRPLVP